MTTKLEGMMIPGKLKWYAILALALWLAFSGGAAAEQLYVNESGWWCDGGAFNASTAPIQAAVGAAGAGDSIYVHGGNYCENVDVDKPRLTLEGEGADVVAVTAKLYTDHVFEVTADYVCISGFTLIGGARWWDTAGLYLNSADNCNISNNNASNSYYGIYLSKSSNNTLESNSANSNDDRGIYLAASSNNTLTNNTMSGNKHNFGVRVCQLSHCIQEIDTSNTVDEKPIYYWVNRQNQEIPNDAGYVGVVNSTNITVRDLTLTKNAEGVLFAYTNNSRIENVTVSNNDDGIYLYRSNNNNLANNLADSNNGDGISMSGSSNTLVDNIASNNKYEGINLWGYSSSSNTLRNNTAKLNNNYGIYLYSSTSNTLANNIALNNDDGGIRLSFASSNTLQNNTAKLNNKYGIHLFDSNSNTLANNSASNNGYDGIYLNCAFSIVISHNTLENNIVNSNNRYGIQLDGAENNEITCNLVQNNRERGFYLWYSSINNNISCNNIIENGNYNATGGGYEWQLYNGQNDDVNVANNWWGTNNEDQIIASIYDWNDNPKRGNATYLPILEQPASGAPTPEEPHTFTTTDAVIALQIAAGSRPPDLRWDVSGDNRVTSLDALMILQAAAGAIEL